jgi:hypothetical protein
MRGALCCVLVVAANLFVLPAVAVSDFAAQSSDEVAAATLTEAKGTVLKSDAPGVEVVSASKPARVGDRLREGMQIATAEKSYAQLKWPDVVARAWANSIYTLAPNQRLVYLHSGQMIFCLDKHRKDKREYVLWSNLLQARVRGTTVFFQTDGKRAQIAVLEGTIDVVSRKDRSVIRLTPGVVYEVTDKSAGGAPANEQGNAATPDLVSATAGPPIPVFESEDSRVSLYAANVHNLYDQPLVTGFESVLPSMGLVDSARQSLPLVIGKLDSTVSQLSSQLLSVVGKTVRILHVPTGVDYAIGPVVGSALRLPSDAVSYFPPTGMIGSTQLPITGQPVDARLVNAGPSLATLQGQSALTGAVFSNSTAQAAAITSAARAVATQAGVLNGITMINGIPTSSGVGTVNGAGVLGGALSTTGGLAGSTLTTGGNLINQTLNLLPGTGGFHFP